MAVPLVLVLQMLRSRLRMRKTPGQLEREVRNRWVD
jgi:hypothetical protein